MHRFKVHFNTQIVMIRTTLIMVVHSIKSVGNTKLSSSHLLNADPQRDLKLKNCIHNSDKETKNGNL
jgi:hypothetical protein